MGMGGSKPDFSNKIGTGMMPPSDMELEIDADMSMLDLRHTPLARMPAAGLPRDPAAKIARAPPPRVPRIASVLTPRPGHARPSEAGAESSGGNEPPPFPREDQGCGKHHSRGCGRVAPGSSRAAAAQTWQRPLGRTRPLSIPHPHAASRTLIPPPIARLKRLDKLPWDLSVLTNLQVRHPNHATPSTLSPRSPHPPSPSTLFFPEHLRGESGNSEHPSARNSALAPPPLSSPRACAM